MTVALVTGLPAFRAKRVCESLLVDADTSVRAVVSPKYMQDARNLVDAMPAGARERVELLEGDTSSIDLGLSGHELARLGDDVEVIHHAAQVTYLNADRAVAAQANVAGTREVLEVAALCRRLRCVVVHSQTSVSGAFEGVFREADLDVGQTHRNAVEETLARAEHMARAAMASLPVAVVRASVIVGDSHTGEIDRFDGPYHLMLLMLTSPADFAVPLPGRGDLALNLVPVDFVANAAVAIGRDPRAPGRTFHLVDSAALPARRVFELFANAAGRRSPRGSVPASLASALLRAPGLERFAASPRSLIDSLVTSIRYDTRNADLVLGPLGLRCPPFASYVDTLAAYVQTRLRERRRVSDSPPAAGAT